MQIKQAPQATQATSLDARIAHDMRSFINTLSLALDVLESDAPQHRERALLVARRSTQDLSDLIDRHCGTTRHAATGPLEPAPQVKPGMRVLVVEDEYLLARTLADQLAQAGCEVVGPAGSIDDALQLVATGSCDCAVVDANLDGEFSTSVVEALAAKEIAAIVLSGYDRAALPPAFERLPFVQKPVLLEQLLALIAAGAPAARRSNG